MIELFQRLSKGLKVFMDINEPREEGKLFSDRIYCNTKNFTMGQM